MQHSVKLCCGGLLHGPGDDPAPVVIFDHHHLDIRVVVAPMELCKGCEGDNDYCTSLGELTCLQTQRQDCRKKKAPNRCLKEENFSDTIRFSLLQWRLQRKVLFITMQMMSQPLIYNSSVYQKINLADFFAFHILTLNNNELYSCVPALI